MAESDPGSSGNSGNAGYFVQHYSAVQFPIDSEGQPGLRRGQLGALHAIAAHFTVRDNPAVVTMPTGSGKTVVLVLSAFLLRARKVLVVTPSRLVRNQITEEFKTLARVRATRAITNPVTGPKVKEVTHRVSTIEKWHELAAYDVIVGTPNCVSPALAAVSRPPSDFFDLVLMDEAHHSPAITWNEILDAFPEARKLLVTATPFRRDRKEIKGTFIFDYPVRQAYEDRVFGHIEFRPVENRTPLQNDVNIAKTAEEIFRVDRSAGLQHYLMVRTDSKTRAAELEGIYKSNTALTLRRVDSSYSLRYIRKTIESLRNNELDGIIAVDMLGEGFDFPNLKIAAVHSPHKSLAATLQFIGRFARTNAPDIGQAKFIAVLQEIKSSVQELYVEGSEWQEIVPMLNDARVQEEMETRTILRTFRVDQRLPVDEETKDLSLYAVRPYNHVKIYRVFSDVDVTLDLENIRDLEIKYREISDDGCTAIFITKEETQPKWAPPGRFAKVEYDLFIVYADRESRLVFICSSRRQEMVYRHLIEQYAGKEHDILSVDVINRVLNDIDNPEAFSVGMRSRMQASSESYRIMVGPNAAKAIKPTDSRMYHRGHAMFRGREGGVDITIGLSSASKVWRNAYEQIPHLLRWCKQIGSKLARETKAYTKSNWDLLPMTQRISVLPAQPAIAVDWEKAVYLNPPLMYIPDGNTVREISLLDCDIMVDREQSSGMITFRVTHNDTEWPLKFELTPEARITTIGWDENRGPTVDWEDKNISLPEFLSVRFPTFFFPDFSMLMGQAYLPAITTGLDFFPSNHIDAVDWEAHNVDIQAERDNPRGGKISVHDYLRNRLRSEPHAIVVYDDGSGEIADFVTIDENDSEIRFTFNHAKGSKGSKPGERVKDVYEVCGQAVKSLKWTLQAATLVDRLIFRMRDRERERMLVGTKDDLKRIREALTKKKVSYQIVIVQPGISRGALSQDNIALPLASANLFITEAVNFDDLRVLGSA